MKQLLAPIIASLFVFTSLVCGQNNDERASVSTPAAVPVASQDEAKIANDEAIKAASRRLIRGTIKAISHMISPETAAYDNCNFVLVLRSDSGEEYVITVPMFVNRQFTPFALLKEGTSLNVVIMPYEETSNEIQEIQTIDDINDFEKDMYYADAIDKDSNTGLLLIDPEKREIWINTLLAETELQLSKYNAIAGNNQEERDNEIAEFRKKGFQAVQKKTGYFVQSNFFVETTHYNPTLLQGIIDLSERCKMFQTQLIVIPCISMQEYSHKELIMSLNGFPFVDYGREQLVYDCLKNNILALDTNSIILKHQADDYIPFSLLGDNHFSTTTNVFIVDEIVSNLDIKKNDYKIKKDYFKLSSMHLPFYSGPSVVQTDPVFEKQPPKQNQSAASIIVAGDSFTTTNNFHSYISSMTMCDVMSIRHDARANITLKDFLEGKYDSDLQKSSLVIFIFSSPYMTANFPTKDLIESQSLIKTKKEKGYSIPISGSQKSIVIERPDSFTKSDPIKAIVDTSSIMAQYQITINDSKTVFDYDCNFRYNGGDNSFLLDIEPDDFIDGKVKLSIDGNTSFKTVILVDPSNHDETQGEE